jgi:formate dehydrogenase maturation protein FdhE
MNKCSCCGSKKNIRELDFDEDEATFFVILCEDCWNELKTILNKENDK